MFLTNSWLLLLDNRLQCGHHRIFIRTMDTDEAVLTVWVAQELHEIYNELWLVALGKGKNFCYIAAHEFVACLGPEKKKSLPVFHAFTGFQLLQDMERNSLGSLEHFPRGNRYIFESGICTKSVSSDMSTIERFVVLLAIYDHTSTCSDVNLARE